jgi:hypothetical protein
LRSDTSLYQFFVTANVLTVIQDDTDEQNEHHRTTFTLLQPDWLHFDKNFQNSVFSLIVTNEVQV